MDVPAWYRLDNVGKFYASQAGSPDQTIFRIAAAMADEVDPVALQAALDATVARFPGFNVCLRSGMFWHYLEPAEAAPVVEAENLPICFGLHAGPKSTLFRVSYYRCRINLEVSHMIADGRGALEFLRSLVGAYVAERYQVPEAARSAYAGTRVQQTEDSFAENYDRSLAGRGKRQHVFHLTGWKTDADPLYMEYHLSAEKAHGLAREIGVSVTSLVIAAVVCAVRETMTARDRKRAIHLDVPVDLRNLFDSRTLRNFFGLAFVTYTPGRTDAPLAEVAVEVQRQLGEGTEPAALKRRMMRMIKLEKNPLSRLVPLFLKDAALAVADRQTAREVTTTVSSLGRVPMDDAVAPYLRGISALTSTSGLNFIVCTYGDDLCIGISSRFTALKVTRALVRVLGEAGLAGALSANRESPALQRSPQCAAALAAAPSPSVFPPDDFARKGTRARTALAAATLVGIALLLIVGLLRSASAATLGAASAAIALNYLFVRNIIVHAPDFLRLIERYFLVLLAMAALGFLATGNLSITTYVVPGLCLAALVTNAVLLVAYRGPFVAGYAKYLIFEIVLGAVPLGLWATGLVSWPYLAAASAAAAVLLLAGLIVLARRPLAAELRKLFSLR